METRISGPDRDGSSPTSVFVQSVGRGRVFTQNNNFEYVVCDFVYGPYPLNLSKSHLGLGSGRFSPSSRALSLRSGDLGNLRVSLIYVVDNLVYVETNLVFYVEWII